MPRFKFPPFTAAVAELALNTSKQQTVIAMIPQQSFRLLFIIHLPLTVDFPRLLGQGSTDVDLLSTKLLYG